MKNNKSIEESQKIDISVDNGAENEEEFKLEKILAETRYITEQDAMRKAAEKYRARPEMDEIFSNTDKQVRLTNNNPLDLDKKPDPNQIKDEKTATTMQAQIMMDAPEPDEDEVVNLTPEIPEGAKVADDVIEDSPELSEVDPEIGSMFSTGDDSLEILKKPAGGSLLRGRQGRIRAVSALQKSVYLRGYKVREGENRGSQRSG